MFRLFLFNLTSIESSTLSCFIIWEQGIRFIIRIVCDYPGRETHMDIPRWLYEKTYEDGDWYDISYGKGYAPNYSNPVFIQQNSTRLLVARFHSMSIIRTSY